MWPEYEYTLHLHNKVCVCVFLLVTNYRTYNHILISFTTLYYRIKIEPKLKLILYLE